MFLHYMSYSIGAGGVPWEGLFTVPYLRGLFALDRIAEQQGAQGLPVKWDQRPEVAAVKRGRSSHNGECDKCQAD